jgi:transcription elongation factor GreA
MTEQIKRKLSEEIQALERELNHELPKELKKAVAMGDLSENAEYHMAKQRQEFVRARLGQLKQRMADLSLVGWRWVLPWWSTTRARKRSWFTNW